MEQGIMSRQDPHAIEWLERVFLPKDNIVWFVESRESQKWIKETDSCIDEESLTSDPEEARHFTTEPRAMMYIIKNSLGSRFIPTEHEFVNNK